MTDNLLFDHSRIPSIHRFLGLLTEDLASRRSVLVLLPAGVDPRANPACPGLCDHQATPTTVLRLHQSQTGVLLAPAVGRPVACRDRNVDLRPLDSVDDLGLSEPRPVILRVFPNRRSGQLLTVCLLIRGLQPGVSRSGRAWNATRFSPSGVESALTADGERCRCVHAIQAPRGLVLFRRGQPDVPSHWPATLGRT